MESLVLLVVLLVFLPPIGVIVLWVRYGKLQQQATQLDQRLAELQRQLREIGERLNEFPKVLARLKTLEQQAHTGEPRVAPATAEVPAPPVPVAAPVPIAVPVVPAKPPVEPPAAPSVATLVPPPTTIPPPMRIPPAAPIPPPPPAKIPAPAVPVTAAPPAWPQAPQLAATKVPVATPPAGSLGEALRPSPPRTAPAAHPAPLSTPAAAPRREFARKAFDIEERLGTNWLSKLGIVILVFGMVFFLAYKMQTMGPAGRVLAGFAVSLSLLGAGLFLEKKGEYALLGRTGIGGGWALLYFTVFAMHHVTAARVLDSQATDLVLLLAVAAGMVVHTMRYDSQTATGIALLLGFATVTVSRDTFYSLSASAVLAAALIFVVLRRRWYELEIFGLLACYINHYLWLRSILEPLGPGRHVFAEFVPSTILLVFYWAVFRASYLLRKSPDENEENVSTIAGILNIGLLLGLLRYQSTRPELAFYALLALGAMELALGQLPVGRRRRAVFLTLTTVGVSLIIAAIPFRYSGSRLSALWLVEAETFFVVGLLLREVVFRHFGVLAALLTSLHLLISDAGPVLSRRVNTGLEPPEWRLAILFAIAAAIFYANAHWVSRRWKHIFETEFERSYLTGVSCLAGLLALAGAWLAMPGAWTAVAWMVLALIVVMAGSRFADSALLLHADGFAAAALLMALARNLEAMEKVHGVTLRMLTLVITTALYYGCAVWRQRSGLVSADIMSAAYTWGGTLLAAILAWKETPSPWLGVTWAGFALALLLAARLLKREELVWQGHTLAVCALLATMANNFLLQRLTHGISLRLITVALVAAILYACTHWSAEQGNVYAETFSSAYSWAGSMLLTVLMWYELQPASVALGWVLFGLLLFELGCFRQSPSLRLQGYIAFFSSFLRLFFVNLNAESAPGELSSRLYTVLPLAAAYYYIDWRLSSGEEANEDLERSLHAPELLNYFGAITLAALVRFELHPDWVAAGWAAMVVVLLAVAVYSARRLYLQQGILLALAVLFRTAFYNFELPRYYPPGLLQMPVLTIGAAVVLLLASLPFAFRLRDKETKARTPIAAFLGGIWLRPEQTLFFIPIGMLTWLLTQEMRKGLITLAWGLEGVVVFLFALLLGQRSYRLTGLGLLLLCVGKIVLVDVWSLGPSDRYLTFIALGIALLLVSFLYTRYRDSLRQYL